MDVPGGGPRPEETAAFEERYANAVRRMRAVAWRGPESAAPTPVRRSSTGRRTGGRLGHPREPGDVGKPGEGEGGHRESSRLSDVLTAGGCLLLAIVFLGILGYGLVSLFT
ncbi:DUF6584 family protein [Streptomyces sp. CBG30]|uniref:DUF6584 family protein n=1 Tax=Streptomyces sp. CBG30 TaxID=2838869 RepID=UPI0035B1BB3E